MKQEKVPKMSLIHLYEEMQEMCGLEVGDEVGVVLGRDDYENGYDYEKGWIRKDPIGTHERYSGCVGVIREDCGREGFLVEFPHPLHTYKCRFPFFSLKLVKKVNKEVIMSDSIKAVHEDIEEYKKLCRYFGEDIRFTNTSYSITEDCYGPHAKQLKEKYEEEQKQKIKRCPHCHKKID